MLQPGVIIKTAHVPMTESYATAQSYLSPNYTIIILLLIMGINNNIIMMAHLDTARTT